MAFSMALGMSYSLESSIDFGKASDSLSPFPVFNDRYEENYDFPRFKSLPWELRNMVWRFALQRRRLIRVSLKRKQPEDITVEEAGDVRYGRPFLYVHGYQLLSKLLRVNSEARRAALTFYQVRLPCVLMRLGCEGTPIDARFGVFPFNPEYDILWFKHARFLTDFLSIVVTRDSRRIGLRNIAMSITNIRDTMQADDPNQYSCPEFIEAVRNIREFYLIAETTSNELQSMKNIHNQDVFHSGIGITQNFGPVMSKVPVFDLLSRDPRIIGRDLARLFLGSDNIPLEINNWELTLRENWGVDPSKMTSRILFMFRDDKPRFPPPKDNFYDGPELERLRLPAAERRLYDASSSSQVPSDQLTVENQVPEREDCVAFGFWLFSLDAFRLEGTPAPGQTTFLWNMLDHWPELGLAYLPAEPPPTGSDGTRAGEASGEEVEETE
ncbi:hypothetical protein F5B17DRAFT_381530 [Nemania serpens]|nr:hypothetical protein F5B17DRAFT_381530 [Nemania serpens]